MTATATTLPARTAPAAPAQVTALLGRYDGLGEPLDARPVPLGLLNEGFRVTTTRGRYFVKRYTAPDTAAPALIVRQHRATQALARIGLPVAAPLADAAGRTLAVIGGVGHAVFPWVDGTHREGTELSVGQSGRLGRLLGRVHAGLRRVQGPVPAPARGRDRHPSADPARTHAHIDRLLSLVRAHVPHDALDAAFDALAARRLRERAALLRRHAHRRPPDARGKVTGWVHGDFHPLNLLYRGDEPAAIVDWDRLDVRPRAEEAVRAAVIFYVHPVHGRLDLAKVRAYADAYREAAGVARREMAAAVHRVWWERLNDFWMLDWRYQRRDRRSDPLFPAASALAVWWTQEYAAVRDAFAD
ncbi:phosphotransferase [Actinacidiphila sp. DG2A-62]|uniref:phosphotransferase n=1 Tax=Actinacidiphila sp. DG2A-62 TaxID=3108821 RepID=UPI002DB688EF|nr:phosphotransferase [Actinacidiphila sp. DG2A-62]MEC3995718.1 phosphotransferase [Actinacidiphila sp. DG2A-62]